jgi:hypothetical protein
MSAQTRRGLVFIGLVLLPFVVGLLFTYQVIRLDFQTDMADQPALDYQDGPRLPLPDGVVPIHGQSLVLDHLPENIVPSDEVSLQRGEILYGIHCTLCHGLTGGGDGSLAKYYGNRPPSDLTGPGVKGQFDGGLYRTLTQGFSRMPPMAENLTPRERWDVINYMRTLAK